MDLLVTVGPLAAQMSIGFAGESYAVADAPAAGELLAELVQDGDTVLVKGSRGVGLERRSSTSAASCSTRRGRGARLAPPRRTAPATPPRSSAEWEGSSSGARRRC